ncbi:MAG: 1-(5-phosphoribosyl)-5-[(5-phosphoribosylamino)methylideneamino]imidazole-4-carboxamide isomerase [Clostridia bacterium]|nr:1-(5-phosphoribosyl)-5-[(5-phosphoribosylamino)methylideneamino]imidazole-4-carboxamide isomerase [Clostridia bacterium]
MQIFPATDILGGKVVRLTKGDYNQVKIYADSPAEMARKFMKDGAFNLHMVDLDGAKDGAPVNFEAIKEAAQIKELFIEVGGGIRDMNRIEAYLDLGVKRVILGTAAIRNYPFVEEAVKKYGSAIAVGVDAKNGLVAVNGWQETTTVNSVEFCKKLRDSGVATVIYTDISKDGMLSGTNLEIYKELSEIKGLDIVASGGITFADEIRTLADMGIYGAIVGKAVYEGKLSLKDALTAAGGAK